MQQGYTAQSVTADLTFILSSLTCVYTADAEGYWIGIDDKKRYEYAMDSSDQPKSIVLFQDPMPQGNYLFFNPFGEGAGRRSPAVQRFYTAARVAANYRLQLATIYMLETLLMTKKEADDGKTINLSSAVARASAVTVDKKTSLFDLVDDTFLKEVNLLFDRLGDKILEFPYRQHNQTAEVTSVPLKDEHFETKYGKDIRKKSLIGFKAAIQGVLGIVQVSDLDKLKVAYDPTEPSVPKFAALCRIYYLIYSRFNDILADFSETRSVNLGMLEEVITRFPQAHAIAKHASQPVPTRTRPAATVQTVDTTGLNLGSVVATPPPPKRQSAIGPEIVGGGFSLAPAYTSQPTPPRNRVIGPEIVGGPVDPYRSHSAPTQSYGGGGGYNQGYDLSAGMQSSFGTQPSPYASSSGILDLNAPSNWLTPATMQRY